MPDELILFEKMQRGDTSALEYFFREYTDMLYYRAFGFVKDNLVAEDIVQEVFIRFWQLRKNLRILFPAICVRPWIIVAKIIWSI